MSLITVVASLILVFSDVLAQQVTTPDGPIKGVTGKTFSGKTYYAYYSIPYAKPPVGSRRFLASEPIDPWTKVHDGTTENTNICYQLNHDYPQENEDCLHMNVFTPVNHASSSDRKLPVIVVIHGGGFSAGSGLESTGGFTPKNLLEKDVVLVSFNYRLGVFGYLSTGDNVIPGNAGLSDQVQALKWVQRNIAAFGGDPNKVTIFGGSAGAASVGYLILSPAAKGLFSASILASGSPLGPWAYQRNHRAIAFKTGSLIDSHFNSFRDSQKLLEVLQGADAKIIDKAAYNVSAWDPDHPEAALRFQLQQGFYYVPVVDSESSSPLVPMLQYEAIASGNINKVPILIGICSEEGLIVLDQYLDTLLQGFDENPAKLNPLDMHISNESAWKEVGKLLKQEYSPSTTFVQNKLGGIQFFTEHVFARPITKHAELQSQFTDVYFYQFSYTGTMGGNTDHKLPGSGNVSHTEESGYIFAKKAPENYPESDQLMQRKLIEIYTNFATYRNPSPTPQDLLQNISWPKVQNGSFAHVNIGNYSETDLVIVNSKPKAKRMEFWNNLYETYGNRPFDTY